MGLLDRFIEAADTCLRVSAGASRAGRPISSSSACLAGESWPIQPVDFAGSVAPKMRVNHAGEVCAQALYLSQAMFSRNLVLAAAFKRSAQEEEDHLAWTSARLEQLEAHRSRLNPIWFAGSFVIGAGAAVVGDRFSLGFLAETERRVAEHLAGHIRDLPPEDSSSRAMLRQMRGDEAGHAGHAETDGGAELSSLQRMAMAVAAKVMTTVSARF